MSFGFFVNESNMWTLSHKNPFVFAIFYHFPRKYSMPFINYFHLLCLILPGFGVFPFKHYITTTLLLYRPCMDCLQTLLLVDFLSQILHVHLLYALPEYFEVYIMRISSQYSVLPHPVFFSHPTVARNNQRTFSHHRNRFL